MSQATYLVGDVFDRLAEIPDGSVDLIVTSPPFLALRSYLPAGHPDKGKEIGSEATPADFLSTLLALTREWRRVLAPHGSIAVELGDSYSGGSAEGTDARNERNGLPTKYAGRSLGVTAPKSGKGWPLDKSLCGIPTLYTWSLAYGRNLLAPDDQLDPWRIRNLIVWHRPNPPVGALGDKVRPSTSYVTVACVARDRWFDLDAERGLASPNTHARTAKGVDSRQRVGKSADRDGNWASLPELGETAGAPPLDCWFDTPTDDVWTIPTAPYKGSHYATFPITLPRRLINLMCPRQVCTTCGEPRRRITGDAEYVNSRTGKPVTTLHFRDGAHVDGQGNTINSDGCGDRAATKVAPTLGWTDCGHDTWRRGRVLDPFGGSGTTGAAASELGRDSILIDLDERNLELARERIGLFLA